MARKIERVFRDRQLTPEEISRDEEVRRQVQAEFPPAPLSPAISGPLSKSLRDAIRASGKTTDQLAQDAGVSLLVLSRFLDGQRDIRMAIADKLAEALGLKLASAS